MRKNKFGLSDKAEKFCRWFVATGKQRLAYLEAYQPKVRNSSADNYASKLMNNPLIQYRISILREEDLARFKVTTERIGLELARIGFADPRELLDENGELLPLHKMPENIARAVQSIDVYEEFDPRTNQFVGRLKKIKLAPKQPALETMAKWKQMIIAQLEIGRPGDFSSMSPEELEAFIRENEATLDAFEKAKLIGSGKTERAHGKTKPQLAGAPAKKSP